jgi:hypothetical protein
VKFKNLYDSIGLTLARKSTITKDEGGKDVKYDVSDDTYKLNGLVNIISEQ